MTPRKADSNKVAAEILAGRHDPLVIMQAIAEVVRGTTRWKADLTSLGGPVVLEDDLTLDEACELETVLGKTWDEIAPTTSAHECRQVLVTVLYKRAGISRQEADDKIKPLSMKGLKDLFDVYEVSADPKGSASGVDTDRPPVKS